MRALTPAELASRSVIAGQSKEWKVERIAWGFIALILVAALLGGFGDGPLSHATASSGSTRLSFERIARLGSTTELRLDIGPEPSGPGLVSVAFDSMLAPAISFRNIEPSPSSSRNTDGELIFEFPAPDDATLRTIVFDLEPGRSGKMAGRITVDKGTHLEFKQFVLP